MKKTLCVFFFLLLSVNESFAGYYYPATFSDWLQKAGEAKQAGQFVVVNHVQSHPSITFNWGSNNWRCQNACYVPALFNIAENGWDYDEVNNVVFDSSGYVDSSELYHPGAPGGGGEGGGEGEGEGGEGGSSNPVPAGPMISIDTTSLLTDLLTILGAVTSIGLAWIAFVYVKKVLFDDLEDGGI